MKTVKSKKINMKTYCIFVIIFFCFTLQTFAEKNKRAIVVGATSGIGRAVAKLLAQDGYTLGLAGRRVPLLESLQKEIKSDSYIKQIDASCHEKAAQDLQELFGQMGGLDLIVISISAFTDIENEQNSWIKEKKTIDVDLVGFWALAHTAVAYFEKQKHGHLVGISSIAGIRGLGHNPVYCGAKAFISTYLEGVRNKMIHYGIPIYVTDIVPGWVDVESATLSDIPGTYWVASVDKAAKHIIEAIKEKKKIAYITKRWKLIAMLLRENPENMFEGVYSLTSLSDLVLDK